MQGLASSQPSQIYDADLPPFPTLPPKGESLECYKLTGREHYYKLTNSKLPKEDTPSEQGTERTLSRGTVTLTH